MKTLLLCSIILLSVSCTVSAQAPSKGQQNAQPLVPAIKAELTVRYDAYILLSCEEDGPWQRHQLSSGKYYIKASDCGKGSRDLYKYIKICTDGSGCKTRRLNGGERYILNYRNGHYVIEAR